MFSKKIVVLALSSLLFSITSCNDEPVKLSCDQDNNPMDIFLAFNAFDGQKIGSVFSPNASFGSDDNTDLSNLNEATSNKFGIGVVVDSECDNFKATFTKWEQNWFQGSFRIKELPVPGTNPFSVQIGFSGECSNSEDILTSTYLNQNAVLKGKKIRPTFSGVLSSTQGSGYVTDISVQMNFQKYVNCDGSDI